MLNFKPKPKFKDGDFVMGWGPDPDTLAEVVDVYFVGPSPDYCFGTHEYLLVEQGWVTEDRLKPDPHPLEKLAEVGDEQ